ncbi:MAG: glycerate kinase [Cyclobacteriaceae bacterium]
MMIIVAPNAFKGSLNSLEVANAITSGLLKTDKNINCKVFPIADGGDGTLLVWNHYFAGKIETMEVHDALGRPLVASIAILPRNVAVIEMAEAVGIRHLVKKELNVEKASSYGLGEMILGAIDLGVDEIILGLGGSATVDAGLGMLQALGAVITGADGLPLGTTSNPLVQITDLDFSKLDRRFRQIKFTLLCDVENPLIGPKGAAPVFGPQKGADHKTIKRLERQFAKLDALIVEKTKKRLSMVPHGGAAGGIAYMLMALGKSGIVNGSDFLLHQCGIEEYLAKADLLITGEGKIDSQTLSGKAPVRVAKLAKKYNVPTIALAGKIEDEDQLGSVFDTVLPINDGTKSLEEAMRNTAKDLENTASQLIDIWKANRS